MRIAALILGILGGLAALLSVLLVAGGAALGAASQSEVTGNLAGAAGIAFTLTAIAFIGAGLALTRPRLAALLLLLAGLGLVLAAGLFAVISAPLLTIAALLAFLGRGRAEARSAAAG